MIGLKQDVIVMNNEKEITPINEDLNVEKNESENIASLIYTVRGKQVTKQLQI